MQIGVTSEAERAEFSLYCIVAGDALTMPLAGDEYVLDVTTELQRAHHPFYLIFCRSVWHHPLRSDAPPLYTEVLFNQVKTNTHYSKYCQFFPHENSAKTST